MATLKTIDLSILLQDRAKQIALKNTANTPEPLKTSLLNLIDSYACNDKTSRVTYNIKLLIAHIYDALDGNGNAILQASDLCDLLNVHRTTLNRYIETINSFNIFQIRTINYKTTFIFSTVLFNSEINNREVIYKNSFIAKLKGEQFVSKIRLINCYSRLDITIDDLH